MKAINRGRLVGVSIILLLLSCAMVLASPPQCGPLEQILAKLAEKYGEGMLWQGRDAKGRLTIVTANPNGTTWTALVVSGPTTCVADHGDSWTNGSAPGMEG